MAASSEYFGHTRGKNSIWQGVQMVDIWKSPTVKTVLDIWEELVVKGFIKEQVPLANNWEIYQVRSVQLQIIDYIQIIFRSSDNQQINDGPNTTRK